MHDLQKKMDIAREGLKEWRAAGLTPPPKQAAGAAIDVAEDALNNTENNAPTMAARVEAEMIEALRTHGIQHVLKRIDSWFQVAAQAVQADEVAEIVARRFPEQTEVEQGVRDLITSAVSLGHVERLGKNLTHRSTLHGINLWNESMLHHALLKAQVFSLTPQEMKLLHEVNAQTKSALTP